MAFERLKNLVNFFDNLKGGELFVRIVEENQELQVEILDLNRIGQLFNQGISSKGELIGVSRTSHIGARGQTKAAGSHYTFDNERLFFDSFRVVTRRDFIEITANPIRDGVNLFDKYTPDLVGLTEESKKKLQVIMLPLIQKHIRNKISRI